MISVSVNLFNYYGLYLKIWVLWKRNTLIKILISNTCRNNVKFAVYLRSSKTVVNNDCQTVYNYICQSDLSIVSLIEQ